MSNVALFNNGYTDDNGHIVFTNNQIIPLAHRKGTDYTVSISIPASTNSDFVMQYKGQVRTVTRKLEGRLVGQYTKFYLEDRPFNVIETTRDQLGSTRIRPNIASIQVPVGSYSIDMIHRRMSRLGYDIDWSQFYECVEDGWFTIRHQGAGCDIVYTSNLPPRAFEPVMGRHDTNVISHTDDKIEGVVEHTTANTGSKSSDEGAHHDEDKSNDNLKSDSRTHDEYVPGHVNYSDSGNWVFTRHLDTDTTRLYGTYDPRTQTWTWKSTMPRGYGSSVEWSAEAASDYEQRKDRELLQNSTYVSGGYASGGSNNNSSSSSGSGSSSSSSSSYTGGSYNWGSGQTSATYTDSNGGQHTIYR